MGGKIILKKPTFPQIAQGVVFAIMCCEFLAFSFGWIHVPKDTEDVKFFYMLFAIMNTILSVSALSFAIQKDNGYIGTTDISSTTIKKTVGSTTTEPANVEASPEPKEDQAA